SPAFVTTTSKAADAGAPEAATPAAPAAPATRKNPYVFVVAMENHSRGQVIGNPNAPYLNGTVVPQAATSAAFADVLPSDPSEPHYVWLEAGSNVFADHTFTTDAPPSAHNSTASTAHLATQIRNAGGGLDWLSYQEGINKATGACPVNEVGDYLPRHNPFIFFQDVAGAPPSPDNAACAAHHR